MSALAWVRRLGPRSLAGQAVAIQFVVVVILVLVLTALAALDAHNDAQRHARIQTRDVATAVALSPSTVAAIESGAATQVLQPETEQLRMATAMSFITVMSPQGVRYTHTNPAMIGQRYLGSTVQALGGAVQSEIYRGTLGDSLRTIVPVRAEDGRVIGMVAAGITLSTLTQSWRSQLPLIATIGLGALVLCLVAMLLTRQILLRHTGGLAPSALRIMYDHHNAVLHSISEGLVVTEHGDPVLINDEARRLLGDTLSSRNRDEAASIPAFLTAHDPTAPISDELYVTDDRVLVVNRTPVSHSRSSAVITLRDRTELASATGELQLMTEFAEGMRSDAHETANRMQTIVALIEMGRPDDAAAVAAGETGSRQFLVDSATSTLDPVVAALLISKTESASAKGIILTLTDGSHHDPGTTGIATTDVLTVLGNLIDNAIDATDPHDPWIEVGITDDSEVVQISVANSGPGMDRDEFERARSRGYSTKPGGDAMGRGLGLALVDQVVQRYRGHITVENTYGCVLTVTLRNPSPATGSTPEGVPPA